MTATSLKMKLEKSLEVFAIGIFLSTLLLFITVVLNVNTWIYCFLPSLFIFSVIGAGMVFKSLINFTRLKGTPVIDSDAFEEKFAGSMGINNMFWVVVVIVAVLVYLLAIVFDVNLLNFQATTFSLLLLVLEVGILTWGLYNIVSQLSFVLFFINIIPTMFEFENVSKKFYKRIEDTGISYDTDTNLNKLIRKYNDRILWMQNHMTEEKEAEYKAKIYIYETCLRDINDIINKIEI